MRYLIYGNNHLVGALGFGAAAWALSLRDQSGEVVQALKHEIESVRNVPYDDLGIITIAGFSKSPSRNDLYKLTGSFGPDRSGLLTRHPDRGRDGSAPRSRLARRQNPGVTL
jgi:hypothetical protein